MQSRGMYIAIPGAIALVWLASRSTTRVRLRRGLVATLAIGALALVFLYPFAPKQGRVGEVSPAFVVAQLSTLGGSEGPGSPVSQRKAWFDEVLAEVDRTPWAWAVGVGLGPDLAFGFESASGLVRKPHNDYLEAYARLGLLGFALFLGLLCTAFVRVVRDARSVDGWDARYMWFAVAQSFVLLVIAATQPLLAFSYGTVPLFFVLGSAIAVGDRHRSRGTPMARAGGMRLRA
jgi:O-antigen ligase